MTGYVDTWPTARQRHRCGLCAGWVRPGETYWRQVGFDGTAWTNKTCAHCERVSWAYWNDWGDNGYEPECVLEWLREEHPAHYVRMAMGWSYPDGERVPLPFGSSCLTCGTRIEFRHLWCPPCDVARQARITRQLESLAVEASRCGAGR